MPDCFSTYRIMAIIPKKRDPSFFAVIPATVRYDKSLPQGAKLLYGEISALANKKGYCWTKNSYFANLYGTSERTIIEWISRLRASGHIKTHFIYFPDSKKIKERRIMLMAAKPVVKVPNDLPAAPCPDQGESGLVVKKTSPLVVKKTSLPSGEENSLDNNTDLNNTAAAADRISRNPEKPPPGKAAAALPGTFCESVSKLKLHFSCLDKTLIFDEAFYPKLLTFLSERDLDLDYISFIYNLCSCKNIRNLASYLFRVLCEPRYAEIYLDSLSQSSPESSDNITCPVCDTSFINSVSECPHCHFNKDYFLDKERIELEKKLFSMPQEVRMAYEEELALLNNGAISQTSDFKKYLLKKKSLDLKYGLL